VLSAILHEGRNLLDSPIDFKGGEELAGHVRALRAASIKVSLFIAADEAQFALSEINWGILPGGGATKVVSELIPMRDAMYHALTGELIDGKKAAQWRLVNESVPRAQLEARVMQLANVLLQKNPVALKATKDAIRRVREMTYDNAEDYLIRAQEAANSFDNQGRKEGIHQFIDEKSYKPGLGTYDKSRAHRP